MGYMVALVILIRQNSHYTGELLDQEEGTQEAQDAQEKPSFLVPLVLLVFLPLFRHSNMSRMIGSQ